MAYIFITGSTDGLGLAAARKLISDGHNVGAGIQTRCKIYPGANANVIAYFGAGTTF